MKMNKKGFTIVELVIVIAVIAILAAVLIPTFSGVVAKANESSAKQLAANAIKASLLMTDVATLPDKTLVIVDSDKNTKSNFDYGYIYTGNSIDGPKELYNDEGKFNTATYITGVGINTLIINPDNITTSETTKEASDLLKATLKTIYGADETIAVSTRSGANGDDITTLEIGTGDNKVVLDCYTSVDIVSNVFVFVPMNATAE